MFTMQKTEERTSVILENKGEKIFAIMHEPYPPLNKKPPVILVFHGFASSKIGTNRSYVLLAETLSKAGFATLRFDFRGSGDSEGNVENLSLEDLVSDALIACNYLKNEGFTQIGFFGSSLGGSISVLTAALFKNVKSMVLWAPVASGQLWLQDWLAANAKESHDLKTLFTTYRGRKISSNFRQEFGQMDAALTLKSLDNVALLHFQGELDETISLTHQKAFEKACKGHQAQSSFITYPQTGHSLGTINHLPEVITKTIEWFKGSL